MSNCDIATCLHISDLERELCEVREKLRIARLAVFEMAHGKQSMRDYANQVLSKTADDAANNDLRGK